jgi:hypothetical protein
MRSPTELRLMESMEAGVAIDWIQGRTGESAGAWVVSLPRSAHTGASMGTYPTCQ